MTSPKDKPSLQELADTGVLKAQASQFASRTPVSFDKDAADILRDNGILGTAWRRWERLPGKRDRLLAAGVRRSAPGPQSLAADDPVLLAAASQLEVLVSEAERGRAWHPAMGTSWDTAEQAAPR